MAFVQGVHQETENLRREADILCWGNHAPISVEHPTERTLITSRAQRLP